MSTTIAERPVGSDDAPPARRAWWTLAWLAPLFPAAERARLGPLRLAAGVLALLAGTVAGLLRTGGSGAFNSIWAEDAYRFLNDSLNHPALSNLHRPFNGYYHLLPRTLTELAQPFGVGLMPAVMSTEAALVTAALALFVYAASAAHLNGVLPRLLVSVPVVAGPVYASFPNNVATLQFVLLYASFWALLWSPSRRSAKAVALVVLFFTGTSTALAALLVPLALLRLPIRRSWYSALLGGVLLVGVVAQVVPYMLDLNGRGLRPEPRYEVDWAAGRYAEWGLPRMVVGQTWMGRVTDTTPLVVLAWAVVLAVVLAALLRLARPAWLLAVLAAGYSGVVFCFAIMAQGNVQYRYALSGGLLLFVAIAALLRPRPGWRWHAPVIAFVAFAAVVSAVNFRPHDYRDDSFPWNHVLHYAALRCQTDPPPTGKVTFAVHPRYRWLVTVPCRMLRE